MTSSDNSTKSKAITEREFSVLMEKFTPFSAKVALAVSGGPDSMALAFCVKRWAQRDCIALIVEHGLREESAAEAAQVKKQLQKMGIPAKILPWKHDAIPARVHEVAREARYDLLTKACHRLGAGDLLLAHQSDDQAETVLMRLAKGSGIDGLAGIAPKSVRDEVRLIRPFLSLSKERLRATCKAARIDFVTDPSNAKTKYARGRLRKIMPLLASEGLTVESLTALAARAREAKDALDHATQTFLETSAQTGFGGSVQLSRPALRGEPREIALRALGASLREVHDDVYPPEHASLSSLFDAIIGPEKEQTRTFYGCIISISENKVTLLREPSAASEILPLSPGATVLWDGRWFVTADSKAPKGSVRALGLPPHDILDSLAPNLRRRIPQGRIRATLPAIWKGNTLRAIPSFDKKPPFWVVFKKRPFP
ncbi:MAG: tRNA lysidine(34) synthetase TilS [Bdellovibrionales bacterium]|jgi:tRNA(Ile)-lysidine synthase